MELKTFFNTVILTTAVFAALITSIANIIISLLNNHRLKGLEKQKQMNEIDRYRCERLYELVLNWHKYDSAQRGKTSGEIAFYRLLNLFMDDSGRYETAKPLLDKCYLEKLDTKNQNAKKYLLIWLELRHQMEHTQIIKQKQLRKYFNLDSELWMCWMFYSDLTEK